MNHRTDSTNSDSMSYAWVGLLIGFALIAFVVWQNAGSDGPGRRRFTTNPDVIELTSVSWQKEVEDCKIPVVVDFWAPWCGPCRKLAPTIDKLATLYSGRVKFCKVNVDDAKDLAGNFGVSGIPALFIFQQGKLIGAPIEGYVSEAQLTKVIEDVLQAH